MRQTGADDPSKVGDRQVDRQGRADRREAVETLAIGHRRRARRGARQDHALRHARQRQLAPERRRGRGKGWDPRGHVERDPERIETPHLFGDRAIERGVPRMDPGNVEAFVVRRGDFGDDLVEGQGRGVDDPRPFRGGGDDRSRHQRTGIETDRATLDQPQPPQRDQIGRARSRADEMHRHRLSPSK